MEKLRCIKTLNIVISSILFSTVTQFKMLLILFFDDDNEGYENKEVIQNLADDGRSKEKLQLCQIYHPIRLDALSSKLQILFWKKAKL